MILTIQIISFLEMSLSVESVADGDEDDNIHDQYIKIVS